MRNAHPIARYLIIQGGIALALPIAWVFVAVGLDVAGLGTLISQSSAPTVAMACMIAASITTFSPLIFMTAVFGLAE